MIETGSFKEFLENKAKQAFIKNDIKIDKTLGSNKSLSEILESFRCISEEYNKFNSNNDDEFIYSDYEFNKCTDTEKLEFLNSQLKNIECLVANKIYDKTGLVWNWFDIYKLLFDPIYKNRDKADRKVVYSTSNNNRPIGDAAWTTWNGLQIIDIDIKDENICNGLKFDIFNELKKYNWFLGCCKSASGKSLHVWTKIAPISYEYKNLKVEYLCNFRHKYSIIYIVLCQYMNKYGYTKDKIFDYMDMAMAKPQQGIFISSDSTALLNMNFKNVRIDKNFETAFNTGIESIDWITHPDLKNVFSKLEWFNNDNFDKENNIELGNISVENRDVKKGKGRKHYKHAQRWQLANTLTSLFGETKAYELMCEICSDTSNRELRGDVKTASIHSKPISIWAVSELNKYHGFNIVIKGSDTYKNEIEKLDNEIKENKDNSADPTKILNDKTNQIKLHLRSNQYLSDIKEDILSNLSHISLLEAGAGYGKTEMVKSFDGKTLLILPFTSTIKAKVEASETTADWLYYYGNKRPTLDELLGSRSMSMTIDKFSHLNVMELDQAGFDYIVIDESHLMFTSSYRDVMSPTIQRLANCKAKIIMMSGTPTGEMLFFPNIKHIKVIKDDLREKKFDLHMCPTKYEQIWEMAKHMADDIVDGKKILFPTNKGNLYFDQITGLVQTFLEWKEFKRPLKPFYYKKSNYGDASMDGVNNEKTFGSNDIICCTTYLSVGVDICDKGVFSIYFDESWIPQDIEQYANRIRNNNLYIHMYLPKKNSDGIPINYYYTQALDLGFEMSDLLLARDLIRTCNDMLERNNEESKYNPLIQSLLGSNRYLKYDENDCKYYIDETTYKLKVFEERYAEFSKQLEVMLSGIKYYGYEVNINDYSDEIPEQNQIFFDELFKKCRTKKFDYNTSQTYMFLDHINDGNIDLYKEILKGNYAIFKDDGYKEVRGDNQLYAEDIEILEKNTPIVLSFYKYYDCDTIKEIYKYCTDPKQNRINYSKLNRIKRFVSIEYNWKKSRLDYPIMKFIKDAQQFAKDNPVIELPLITEWQGMYAAKICNSIKDVVVQDVALLESIFEIVQDLWKVIIIQSKPSSGHVSISPFELLWENKHDMINIYGNYNTKQFFLQELENNMKEIEELEEPTELPELPVTQKLKLDDVEKELPNVIHKDYNYFEYSEQDKSNERFMRKQENTNTLGNSQTKENPTERPTEEMNLFSEINYSGVPF